MQDKHLFEKAAAVLEVALDASPTVINKAYQRAKVVLSKPAHLLEMAYQTMITATAGFRVQAVRLFHKNRRYEEACTQLQDTPAQRHAREDIAREMEMKKPTQSALQSSLNYLHLSMGHY